MGVHGGMQKLVLKNVYRSFYDIANDRQVRKPDMVMRAVVETSEAL